MCPRIKFALQTVLIDLQIINGGEKYHWVKSISAFRSNYYISLEYWTLLDSSFGKKKEKKKEQHSKWYIRIWENTWLLPGLLYNTE